jgi:N-acetylneuraminate synthase
VIAELSANHGGRLDTALKTVEAAAKTGVDAIKLQTYTPDTLTLRSDAPDFVVRTNNVWAGRTLYDLYGEAMTPWEWHQELMACARSCGLLCFSTPFDVTALEFLEQLGVPAHKVASFELVDLPLIDRIARTGKPMILSTGMATLGEIEAALQVCRQAGNDRLALLRCVSAYPAQPETMNLGSLDVLKALGVVIGLSDHTRDHTAAIAAVARGARLVEKHFILDRSVGGPDAFFSLEPAEMSSLVTCLRDAQAAVAGPRFGPAPEERASLAFRRSLYFAADVKQGEVLTCDHVRSVRPAHGLPAKHLPEVLGRVALHDVAMGTAVTWDDLGSRPTGGPSLTLTAATSADSELLLAWRNDPLTRAMSVNQHEVSVDEHARWLASILEDDARWLMLVRMDEQAIAVVRLDARGADARELSLTLAPEARGRGLAKDVLLAAEAHARSRGVRHLLARILPGNARSIAAFKRAGYYGFAERGAEPMLWCERRIVAYP